MRTTKTFAVAIVVTSLLATPVFAVQQKAKRQARTQDEQPTIVRIVNGIKHLFDLPIVTQPTDLPIVTQPSDLPIVTQPH